MAKIKVKCEPELTASVKINGDCNHYIYMGRIKDSGRNNETVHFDADGNFVVLEVGKRGSGKSFGMGTALEAFCTCEPNSSLGSHGEDRRGVLLLDPLDVHWTAIFPLCEGISPQMSEQYRLLRRWPEVNIEPINVRVFMPAGRVLPEDPAAFVNFQIPVSDLTPDDFALLYNTNLVRDPAGMLLFELYEKVTRLGYVVRGAGYSPKAIFGLEDLLRCLDDDEIRDQDRGFNRETIRAVNQRLRTWLSDPLFQSNTGTPISELIRAGQLSILCLNRLSEDMRSVITGVIVRKIKKERTRSSQVERRKAFDTIEINEDNHMPRVILAIDEHKCSAFLRGRPALKIYSYSEGRTWIVDMARNAKDQGAIQTSHITAWTTLSRFERCESQNY